MTSAQSQAVSDVVTSQDLSMADIDVVGFHGQTVLHRAPQNGILGMVQIM